MPLKQPVLLCILDGFGNAPDSKFNAISNANTPNLDAIRAAWPVTEIDTSGFSVGLPQGQMGNSEVGHMTIGAGRIMFQSLPRIDQAIETGELQKNPYFIKHVEVLKASGGTCQLLGLLSDGGVHSHILHIIALAKALSQQGVSVAIHAFLDGRDTPPESAMGYVIQLQQAIAGMKNVTIATIGGRYFAMDRDNRWERVQKAYDTMVLGKGNLHGRHHTADPITAIKDCYKQGVTDEFIEPMVIGDYAGMKDGDGLLMANFRADRARQMLDALLDPAFNRFPRERVIAFPKATGMVEYSDHLNQFMDTLYPVEAPLQTLGQLVAEAGGKQLRIAETEKYAHVTFFFNGGLEAVYPGEERILIPSPKVATYDLQPEMSAPEVTEKLVNAVQSRKFDLIVVNYANGDMVGHTGDMEAAKKAVETIDTALGILQKAVVENGYAMLITADHGNCEEMHDAHHHAPHTQHTTNTVPLIVINAKAGMMLTPGGLSDIAPSILHVMGLAQPAEMTGHSLIH